MSHLYTSLVGKLCPRFTLGDFKHDGDVVGTWSTKNRAGYRAALCGIEIGSLLAERSRIEV